MVMGLAGFQFAYLPQHVAGTQHRNTIHFCQDRSAGLSWPPSNLPHRQQCAHYALLHASMRQPAQDSAVQREQLPGTANYIAASQVPPRSNPLLRCLLSRACLLCLLWPTYRHFNSPEPAACSPHSQAQLAQQSDTDGPTMLQACRAPPMQCLQPSNTGGSTSLTLDMFAMLPAC